RTGPPVRLPGAGFPRAAVSGAVHPWPSSLPQSNAMATGSPPHAAGTPRATRLGVIAVLIPISGFSVMNVIVKLAHLQALAFAFYRLWMGAAIMVIGLLATGRRLSAATLRRAAPAGVLFGANLALFFSALKLTSITD